MLQQAMESIAEHEPTLEGAVVSRWYVITEHQWADGERVLSSFRSKGQSPWETLGLLRFFSLAEEQRIVEEDMDGEP